MSGVQIIEVDEDGQDQRLDRFLRRIFPELGQGRIEKMCRKGECRVDGGRVKASSRLSVGQSVRVPPLPDTSNMPRDTATAKITKADAEMIREAVLYKDDYIIAINKPQD